MAGIDPVKERLADSVRNRGFAGLRELTSGPAGGKRFLRWLRDPITLAMIKALEVMAVNPGLVAGMSDDQILVQFGVTSGLQAARSLLCDPSNVAAGMFKESSEAGTERVELAPDYVSPPEGV